MRLVSGPSRPLRLLLVIVLVLLAATAALVSTPARVHAEDASGTPVAPPRVMIAGDSISNEFSGDYSWRYRLHREFARQLTPVIFVRPYTGNHGPDPRPLIPFSGDHHDALGGTKLSVQVSQVHDVVATYHPDVVLLMMGFNDLNHGASAAAVIADMRTYLTNLWAAAPDVTVVLSHVLKDVVYPTSTPRSMPRAQVNAGYDALAAEFAQQGRHVVIADETSPWVPTVDTVDGVHPNPTGEMVIAQHYAVTLHRLGLLPQLPHLTGTRVAWATRPIPTVRVSGHVVRFGWTTWKARLDMFRGDLYVRRAGTPRPIRFSGQMFADVVRRRMPKGRYTVRLRPVRKWLVGSYGPAVRFTVR